MKGFTLFDQVHVSWLIFIIGFCLMTILFYKHSNFSRQRSIQITIFVVLVLLELAKQLILLITNSYSAWSPPLHLCGIGMFVIGWHIFSPNRTTTSILYSLTLPGAAIALLFPGWANERVGSFLHIHSFLFHGLLILFVLILLCTKQLVIQTKDFWRSVVFLIFTVPIIYWYNAHFQTNFMFLNAPVKNTPLQWLYDAVGNSGYLIGLSVVVAIIIAVLYSPLILRILNNTHRDN